MKLSFSVPGVLVLILGATQANAQLVMKTQNSLELENSTKMKGVKDYQTAVGKLVNGYTLEAGAALKMGEKLSISSGFFSIPSGGACWFDGTLTIIAGRTHAAPLKVTLVQDKATGEWLATDGLLVTQEGQEGLIEGHVAEIVGGQAKPVKIGGREFADCTVEIRDGKPAKREEADKGTSSEEDVASHRTPASPQVTFAAGETVVVTEEGTKFMLGERVVAELPKGTAVKVARVKGNWVGGTVQKDGKELSGWVRRNQVGQRESSREASKAGPDETVIALGKEKAEATGLKKGERNLLSEAATPATGQDASGAEANAIENRIIESLAAGQKAGERLVIKGSWLEGDAPDNFGRNGPQKATVMLVKAGDTKDDGDIGRIAVVGGYWEEDGGLWMPAGSVFSVRESPQLEFIAKRPSDTIYAYKGVARILRADDNLADFLPLRPGSVHRFLGEIPFGGCVFRGAKDDPLTFGVVAGLGYVYLRGRGTVVLEDGSIFEVARDGSLRQAGKASGELARKLQDSKKALALRKTPRATSLPAFQRRLDGGNEVRVRNPNDFSVAVGVRTGDGGRDFEVSANGVNSVHVPDGKYDIYFVYSNRPDALFQGDSFTLSGTGVEIQIVKVVGGNYGIRQVE